MSNKQNKFILHYIYLKYQNVGKNQIYDMMTREIDQ